MAEVRSRFESIEDAHEYVGLLREVVGETRGEIAEQIANAGRETQRQLDALRLVDYKLGQLHHHLVASSRMLNDLRTLRRALYSEREITASVPALSS